MDTDEEASPPGGSFLAGRAKRKSVTVIEQEDGDSVADQLKKFRISVQPGEFRLKRDLSDPLFVQISQAHDVSVRVKSRQPLHVHVRIGRLYAASVVGFCGPQAVPPPTPPPTCPSLAFDLAVPRYYPHAPPQVYLAEPALQCGQLPWRSAMTAGNDAAPANAAPAGLREYQAASTGAAGGNGRLDHPLILQDWNATRSFSDVVRALVHTAQFLASHGPLPPPPPPPPPSRPAAAAGGGSGPAGEGVGGGPPHASSPLMSLEEGCAAGGDGDLDLDLSGGAVVAAQMCLLDDLDDMPHAMGNQRLLMEGPLDEADATVPPPPMQPVLCAVANDAAMRLRQSRPQGQTSDAAAAATHEVPTANGAMSFEGGGGGGGGGGGRVGPSMEAWGGRRAVVAVPSEDSDWPRFGGARGGRGRRGGGRGRGGGGGGGSCMVEATGSSDEEDGGGSYAAAAGAQDATMSYEEWPVGSRLPQHASPLPPPPPPLNWTAEQHSVPHDVGAWAS